MNEVPTGSSSGHDEGVRTHLLGRLARRLVPSRGELEAQRLRADAEKAGATPIQECGQRQKVAVAGTLRTVTLQPRDGAPAVEAELYDGSGVVDLVWLGRRRIAGIEPGRMLRVEGLLTEQDGRKVLFNPRYELWSQEDT